MENLVKFGRVVPEIYACTDTLITIIFTVRTLDHKDLGDLVPTPLQFFFTT